MIKCSLLSENPDVMEAIDGELDYQNSLMGTNRAGTYDYRVASQLLTLGKYHQKAVEAWTSHGQEEGERLALEELRKCAAICVRALILYGCPERKR